MADAIKTAIANYLNSLDIGEDLTISALWGVALATMTDITKPVFSITSVVAGTAVDNQSANDIIIAFNATTSGILANIIINAT
jgi:hypothetical protein